ncbi:hypothetical protein AAJL88_02955 [Staphylococcus hominis]|uniref:hypothetical protein n=1 Tax=Staphylococcus hominis TaxID=1290 RepID=UPI0031BB5095
MAIVISLFSLFVSIATFIWNYNRNRFKMSVKIVATAIKPNISISPNIGIVIVANFENNSANPITIGSISVDDIYSVKETLSGNGYNSQKITKSVSSLPCDLSPYQAKKLVFFIPMSNPNLNKTFVLNTYTTRGVHKRSLDVSFYKINFTDLIRDDY